MVFPFIAAAFTVISTALSSLGPVISTFATKVLPTLVPYISKGLEVMVAVGRVAEVVSQVLGVLKPGETTSDMGERALQAAAQNIVPDKFDDFESYMQSLRDFELDPAKRHDPMASLIAGLAVVSGGMDAKLDAPEGSAGSLWQLVAADGDYFTADKILQLVQAGQNLADVVDYYSGTLDGAESLQVEDRLVKLDKENEPDVDEDTLRQRIYAVQDRVQAGAEH